MLRNYVLPNSTGKGFLEGPSPHFKRFLHCTHSLNYNVMHISFLGSKFDIVLLSIENYVMNGPNFEIPEQGR